MLGVDRLDQLVTYYSFVHKTIKWWRKVFFWMLEVTIINSYIIHRERARQNGIYVLTHKKYRKALVTYLSEPLLMTSATRTTANPRPQPSMERLQSGLRHTITKGTKRRDCVVCSTREEGGRRHLTRYMCSTCRNHPAFCPTCFNRYHSVRDYHT